MTPTEQPLSLQEEIELHTLLEAEQRARSRRMIDRVFPADGPLRRELYPEEHRVSRGGRHTPRAGHAGRQPMRQVSDRCL